MQSLDKTIDLKSHPRRYVGKAASPFRYPGGKGFLSPFLAAELSKRFGATKPRFAEPFCGGAGAALNLLVDGHVAGLYLNDADVRIYSAWHAIVYDTPRFLAKLNGTEANVMNWERYQALLYDTKTSVYDFEVGFAAFFVNRTSRSGVLLGSGPIGGYDQSGKWKIDARYNREALSLKIAAIGALREHIQLSNIDGLQFCELLEESSVLPNTFLFIDPPYVTAGRRLYHDGMSTAKHDKLSTWLQSGRAAHWLLTYDDHPTIRDNYRSLPQFTLDVQYSLGRRRLESELLYMSGHLNIQ